jgi:hypothetical protein
MCICLVLLEDSIGLLEPFPAGAIHLSCTQCNNTSSVSACNACMQTLQAVQTHIGHHMEACIASGHRPLDRTWHTVHLSRIVCTIQQPAVNLRSVQPAS